MTDGVERGALRMTVGAAYLSAVLLGVRAGVWFPLWITVGLNAFDAVWSWRVRWWLVARRRRRELRAWARWRSGGPGVAPDRRLP